MKRRKLIKFLIFLSSFFSLFFLADFLKAQADDQKRRDAERQSFLAAEDRARVEAENPAPAAGSTRKPDAIKPPASKKTVAPLSSIIRSMPMPNRMTKTS